MNNLISWDIYEISTGGKKIQGVDFRGRLREFSISKSLNLLVDNATDKENIVRFAVVSKQKVDELSNFIKSMEKDAKVKLAYPSVKNPVLSNMWVNRIEIERD